MIIREFGKDKKRKKIMGKKNEMRSMEKQKKQKKKGSNIDKGNLAGEIKVKEKRKLK